MIGLPISIPRDRTIGLAPAKAGESPAQPELTLGGVALPAQPFVWRFTPGASPYRMTVRVPIALDPLIAAVPNPTALHLKVAGNISGMGDQAVDVTLARVYIQEPRRSNAFQTIWEIADRRRELVGHTVTIMANMTWRLNALGTGLPAEIGTDDPAILREQFDRFSTFRYLPWSRNPTTSRPWTAHQLLVKILTDEFGACDTETGVENGYVEENIDWQEMPTTEALTHLASLAREDFGIAPDGTPYVYPTVDIVRGEETVIPLNRPSLDGSVIYRADLSRVRPPQVAVKFACLREVQVVNVYPCPEVTVPVGRNGPVPVPTRDTRTGIEYPQEDQDAGRIVGCWNVVQLPVDADIQTADGLVRHQRGCWVPMDAYLTHLKIDDELVRQLWFSNMLEIYYAGVLGENADLGQLDPLRLTLIGAVRQHYRRSYQMDPYWVQRWRSWSSTRCTVVDPVTRFSGPSPLWANYCIVPKVRLPQMARYPDLWRDTAYNVIMGDDNTAQVLDEQSAAAYTAGTIRLVDGPLGIFAVEYPRSVDQIIAEIIPSAVKPLPTMNPDANRAIFMGCELQNWHALETIVSVQPAVDPVNSDPEKAWVKFPIGVTPPGKGPLVEYLSRIEVARYPVLRGLTATEREAASAALATGLPINVAMLAAIAHVEARRLAYSWKDRLTGYGVFPGVDTAKLRLFGPCRGITIEWSDRGLRSEYDLTIPPTAPDLVQQGVPEAIQRFVQRRLAQEA